MEHEEFDMDIGSFDLKSKRYRKRYIESLQGLYGNESALKAVNSSIAKRSKKASKGTAKNRKRSHDEENDQIRLSMWLHQNGIRHTASANGGKRDIRTGARLKAMGVSAGFPDIEIPLPRNGFHGLYLELKKREGGKLSPAQAGWLEYLNANGYHAVMASGFEEARNVILGYIGHSPII